MYPTIPTIAMTPSVATVPNPAAAANLPHVAMGNTVTMTTEMYQYLSQQFPPQVNKVMIDILLMV